MVGFGDIGAQLRARRTERGLSRVIVARRAGCCERTVLRAETGRSISLQSLVCIAQTLGYGVVVCEPGPQP